MMKEIIKRLRELEKETKRPPWVYNARRREVISKGDSTIDRTASVCGDLPYCDGVFISDTRNALPALLDRLEHMEQSNHCNHAGKCNGCAVKQTECLSYHEYLYNKSAERVQEVLIELEKTRDKLAHYEDMDEQERLIQLPCKVGDTVYVLCQCGHVIKSRDDDWITGIGNNVCPFKDNCDNEKCDIYKARVFETILGAALYNEQGLHLILNGLNTEANFGENLFLTRAEAEEALEKIMEEQ